MCACHYPGPQARRVGLQIPSELRMSQSLEFGSLNPKRVALQVCACCSYEHSVKAAMGLGKKAKGGHPLFSHSSHFSSISIAAPRPSRLGSRLLCLVCGKWRHPPMSHSASLRVRAA